MTTELDRPELDELVAVLAAVDSYAKARGETSALARDTPRLMEELATSLARVRAVTR